MKKGQISAADLNRLTPLQRKVYLNYRNNFGNELNIRKKLADIKRMSLAQLQIRSEATKEQLQAFARSKIPDNIDYYH